VSVIQLTGSPEICDSECIQVTVGISGDDNAAPSFYVDPDGAMVYGHVDCAIADAVAAVLRDIADAIDEASASGRIVQ
jgi:hypothetical protein